MSSIPFADRTKSVAIFGKTGMGKTTFMEELIREDIDFQQDVDSKRSAIVLDPHGDLTERLLTYASNKYRDRLLVIKADADYPFGLNIFECDNSHNAIEVDRVVDGVLQVFKKLWGDNPILLPRMEHIIANTSRTIIANPRYTMAEIPALLTDKDKRFRDELIRHVKNTQVKHFWEEYAEIAKRPFDRVQYIESVSNRLSQFLSSEFLYKVVAQAHTTIDFHKLLEGGKTVIVSLPIGELGEGVTGLLGSLFLARLTSAVFAREKIHAPKRTHLYIDEYQRFATSFTSVLLREGRKFNLGTTIAVQSLANLGQEPVSVAAVLQVGTLVCFQTIGQDAEVLAKQFPLPEPTAETRQEPMLLYSRHAIEDIYHNGHTSELIKKISYDYFWPPGYIGARPQENFFPYDATSLCEIFPNWGVFADWQMCRSSRAMITDGVTLLNIYYYNWMSRRYHLHQAVSEEELHLVLNIIENLTGILGMRPVMVPFVEEATWHYLMERGTRQIEEKRERLLEEYRHRQDLARYYPTEDDYIRYLQREGLMQPLALTRLPATIHIQNLQETREMLGEIGLSLSEVDKLINWKVRELEPLEQEYLTDYAKILLMRRQLPKAEKEERLTKAIANYIGYMANYSVFVQTGKAYPTLAEAAKHGYGDLITSAIEKAKWQEEHLREFILFVCLASGSELADEPVLSPSSRYEEKPLTPRTFGDIRDELTMRLASLPPFTYYTQREGKTQAVKLAKPEAITGSAYAKALILTNSQKTFGKDWRRIEREIEHRQKHIDYQPAPIPKPQVKTGLPPAKPQI